MTLENFKKRVQLGLVFLVLSLLFFVVSSEDLFQYVVLTNLPALQNTKLLTLHVVANMLLFGSKLAIGIVLLRIYVSLKSQAIPFIGFLWIFAIFYILMSGVFAMNLLALSRVYIWIDGLIRACAGLFGTAAAVSLIRGYKYIITIKAPEEYAKLANEIHELREENKRLQEVLNKQSKNK